MRVCGIVAEYNPFHNGHQYHLEETRKKLKADIIIVVMSGNFLQRGEPAIVDKWSRARAALMNGADIVVELPTDFSVQPADFFC
ncbi:MAG: nucleotidyltransferase family protein [Alkalibacterium thalassium]|nr:nucleotidyltransferase family protein [Alkalibacterium thalassium]